MEYVLETEDLTKIYDHKAAADGVNLHIREGQIYGLIGRNGAGKTTIMRMVGGLIIPTRGSYKLFGKSGDEMRRMLRHVGTLIESPGTFPQLSAYENMKIKCIGMGIKPEGTAEELLKAVGLGDTGKKAAGHFSLGMQQRLGIALALVGEPRFLILDEPINGLDPQGIAEVRETLVRLRDERGLTIMISSHILDELGRMADAYGIINEGVMLDEFTAEDLRKRSGRYVTIRTNDPAAAMEALKGIGVMQMEIENDGSVRVNEQPENSDRMAKAVFEAGLSLRELVVTNVSLEDYFLGVTGGKKDA